MKKIGIAFLFMIGVFSTSIYAQAEQTGFNLRDRIVPHVGFVQMIPTQTIVQLSGASASGIIDDVWNESVVIFTNFHVGAYTNIFHHKDIVSVGIDNSVQVGIRPYFNTNALPVGYNVQVPIFLMGRLGNGATPYNQQRFGIGAGIGASINTMRFTMLRPNENPNIGPLPVIRRTTYVNPSAIFEISYGNLIGRLQLGILPVNTKATDETINNPGDFNEVDAIHGMLGYGLIYRFN